jgi:VanZ family protein
VPINQNVLRQYSTVFLVLVLMAIYFGGEQPGAGQLFLPPWDKVAHFVAFGAIGVLAGLAWPNMSLAKTLALVVAIGMSDEIHQLFIAGRVAGLDDLAADFFGGLVVLPLIARLRRFFYPDPESI